MGCVLVTDSTNPNFESAEKWKNIIEEHCDYIDNKPIPIIFVQNKIDIFNKKTIKEKIEDKEMLSYFNLNNKFFDSVHSSAKENKNVNEIFEKIIEEIVKRNLLDGILFNIQREKKLNELRNIKKKKKML